VAKKLRLLQRSSTFFGIEIPKVELSAKDIQHIRESTHLS